MTRLQRTCVGCLLGLITSRIVAASEGLDTSHVLGDLHHSNQKEILMGKMAIDHGLSAEVQAFGRALVKDHSAADKKVVSLAKEEKVDLAANTPPVERRTDDDHTGTAFDDAFVQEMLDAHTKDIAAATAARDATPDPKLKQLLSELLPILQKHQQMAEKLAEEAAKRHPVAR